MEKTDCLCIGSIHKTFGYKGELTAEIHRDFTEIILKEGVVFIETDEELVPFFIESCKEEKQGRIIVKFEDIADERQAKKFTGCKLWLPLALIPEELRLQPWFTEIRGFTVIDKQLGMVGIAQEWLEMPQQILLRVLKDRKEILIPANEEFLLKIDREKKVIFIRAPKGLIESYLH